LPKWKFWQKKRKCAKRSFQILSGFLKGFASFAGGFFSVPFFRNQKVLLCPKQHELSQMKKSEFLLEESAFEHTLRLFSEKRARISVLGCGYVGLPLCVAIAKSGYFVNAIDLDLKKVRQINQGISYIEGVSSEELKEAREKGKLEATSSFEAIGTSNAVVLCVPTPLNAEEEPDLSWIQEAVKEVASFASPNLLIALESTTYPGTTREVVLPYFEERGFCPGKDIFICFSPERIDPGRKDWTVLNTPKVIGGVTPECLELGRAFYASFLEKVIPVSSVEVAEMAKIVENSFRLVNIAFANEILKISERLGIDAWEIFNAAATKPFGFMKFDPGPGVGGHCIPVDPLYLSWRAKQFGEECPLIALSHEINKSMPAFWVAEVEKEMERNGKALLGASILILGVAYKKDVGDLRESPALKLIDLLQEKGALISYFDPYFSSLERQGHLYLREDDLYRALQETECAVLVTDHAVFRSIDFDRYPCSFVDTRSGRRSSKKGRVHLPEEKIYESC